MGNMSYCRFENTFHDLQDCYNALHEAGSVRAYEEDANNYELPYIRRLIELALDIVDDFSDEL